MPAGTRRSAALSEREAATLAKALAHPARVRIVRLLLQHGECFCGELCEHLPLAQSTVSQHLRVLREAGLVRSATCGRAVGYTVDRARLEALASWLRTVLSQAPLKQRR